MTKAFVHFVMCVYPPKNNNAPRQRRELTKFQKGQIVEARGLRMSYSEIGKELCIPRSMVSSFLTQSKQRDYVTNLPRPGRPPAISESQERYIIQTVNTNTRIPFTELCNITNTNVSIRTIQRHLQNHNLQKWRAAKHTLLTQEHAKKCLKWAMAHGHWKVEDWKRVFWSDECAVKKDSD